MKKLSPEEVSKMKLLPIGNMSPFYRALILLEAGEHLLITRKEWVQQKTPSSMTNYIEKNSKKRFEVFQTQELDGWVVKRIE